MRDELYCCEPEPTKTKNLTERINEIIEKQLETKRYLEGIRRNMIGGEDAKGIPNDYATIPLDEKINLLENLSNSISNDVLDLGNYLFGGH